MKSFNIIKSSGNAEPFSEEKYRISLRRSGASDADINIILAKIQPLVKNNMTTKELYKITRLILHEMQMLSVGGRYHLREAIRMLGPSGFLFERYCAELFKTQGFNTTVDVHVRGKCVSHEIDIIATKQQEKLLIECKFHSGFKERCPIQIALYLKSRYDDVKIGCEQDFTCKPKYTACWLVTNTKISSVAIDYGLCVGINLLGWAYPRNNGLEKIIEESKSYPITCLTFLPQVIKQELFRQGIIFCRDLIDKEILLKKMGVDELKIRKFLQECRAIIG